MNDLGLKYFWVRVFEYDHNRDQFEKGIMLDEFYLKDVPNRDEAKKMVKERYCNSTASELKFSKPKKDRNGIYAIVMDSDKYWYDRFYLMIDTYCFWCHKPVKGKASEFPRACINEQGRYMNAEDALSDLNQTAYFCTYDHRSQFNGSQHSGSEGEFQEKEEGRNGAVFGYIYLIYNRAEDIYYIGQTRFMPFFRWQEHVRDGSKGAIGDLTFCVLAEINRDKTLSDEENQQLLSSIEGWWISKYEQERYNVKNVTRPKITVESLKQRFNDMVIRQEELQFG